MNNCDLPEIAHNICAIANYKLAKTHINITHKWILTDEEDGRKNMTLSSVELINDIIIYTIHSLKDESIYKKFREYIQNNESIQNMISYYGDYYGVQPKNIIYRLMKAAFLKSEKYFDSTKLINEFNQLIANINSGVDEITLIGRLHGVRLESELIEIESDISLIRLDKQAINERQPLITEFGIYPAILDYSDSNVEIKIKEQYQISLGYNIMNMNWQNDLIYKLDNVVKSIKLCRHGRFYIYPIRIYSTLTGEMPTIRPDHKYTTDKVILSIADINDLKKAFSIVKNISGDNVLERSFSRFLIGLDELISEEKIVDFVIAWESLLQTVDGKSNKAELAYRFSLNGATILCEVDNNREFTEAQTLMKEVYNIRSAIVHGGDSSSISKTLKKLGFDNLVNLNNELAKLYRNVIFWLSELDKQERPYYKSFGWELLLRK
ncbi:HEPN domain-containing protein [Pseudanabaena sp. ABRG5-3]|uniref:HEPN domain-containing protein n=1 Tax=Pseudanabaena sp. ABRG5-3 TaxID=685565 RepID=UPI000DC6E51B|nr:HEPN domain-containing protein [Pseudanabaena sp. ABRG5-3]BBC22876.1 hypothetical protein ABRG53_0619 [Pseudanabaena sp. ABRG5-3]